MLCRSCSFKTERLIVKEWHSFSSDEWMVEDLAAVVVSLLTPNVTRSLPEAWQGRYTFDRARRLVHNRDREGATLLVVDESSKAPIGLVILTEIDIGDDGATEVCLGYLIAESFWGKGLASELVRGFVEWCRGAKIEAIVAGVARDNAPSRRVLEKNGFLIMGDTQEAEQQFFELRLR